MIGTSCIYSKRAFRVDTALIGTMVVNPRVRFESMLLYRPAMDGGEASPVRPISSGAGIM